MTLIQFQSLPLKDRLNEFIKFCREKGAVKYGAMDPSDCPLAQFGNYLAGKKGVAYGYIHSFKILREKDYQVSPPGLFRSVIDYWPDESKAFFDQLAARAEEWAETITWTEE